MSDWRARAGSPFSLRKRELVASEAVVASNHPLASAAGLEMLARGGNAFDAAIATAFALTVVEPMMVSIFGAGMIVVRSAGAFQAWDNYAVAPRAATEDMYAPDDARGGEMPAVGRANEVGYRAVGVPGTLRAWCQLLAERGTVPLRVAMGPAIRHAAEGYRASPYLVDCIREAAADLARFPASAEVFLPGGGPPAVGEMIRRRDYARTLETIAMDGPEALYDGPIGEAVCGDMARNGGIITMEDLRGYRIERREPVRGRYRGCDVVSAPPTSSGGTHIVEGLNILEGFDVAGAGFGTARGVHLLAETLKLCFADRFAYMGDPAFVDVPVAGLIDKGYAAGRRASIDLGRAGRYAEGRPGGGGQDTTHLTVADRVGNVVCMTQTLHALFGSKVTVPGTGMLLNNNMWLFDPHPGRANSVAPGKRMLSSMSPTIVERGGELLMALGTPGGTRIFPAIMQAIVNVVDHGMTLQEAVEAPRVWSSGGTLLVEEGIAPSVRSELVSLGHELEVVPRVAGGMNGVGRDGEGLLHGAACWRADGTAAGYSGGFTDVLRGSGVPS
ncbi:MAG: gamma-glutamyltransferase [Deltaproteobacteria bacterium]|nr:gamma-glutamyltransferase [Deltaproteobacteria bacterium]